MSDFTHISSVLKTIFNDPKNEFNKGDFKMSLIEILNTSRKINGVETHIIYITPNSAKYILDNCNKHNRRLRESVVLKYKQEILNDEWRLTASGIGIDSNGVLCDGQHRLNAIIESGRAIPCLVVTGISPKSQEKIDRHSKRSIVDVFKLSGYIKTGLETSVATALAELKVRGAVAFSKIPVSDSEIKNALECHNESIQKIVSLAKTNIKGLCRSGFLSALVLYHELDPVKCVKFFEQILSGEMLNQNDPAMRLRKYLLGETQNGKTLRGGNVLKVSDYKKTVNAINAFHQFKKMTRLAESEDFDFKGIQITRELVACL